MSPEEARRTQKPYRYGMILLCFGALINWIGLAEDYTEPIRYAGIACIIAGALLICTAMCCWLHTPNRSTSSAVGMSENDDPIHVISISEPTLQEKPPEYETVAIIEPPCYDDAIKLDPNTLLQLTTNSRTISNEENLEIITNSSVRDAGRPSTSSELITTIATINTNNNNNYNNNNNNDNDSININTEGKLTTLVIDDGSAATSAASSSSSQQHQLQDSENVLR